MIVKEFVNDLTFPVYMYFRQTGRNPDLHNLRVFKLTCRSSVICFYWVVIMTFCKFVVLNTF